MYRITTDNHTLYTDAIRYIRLHKNGCYVACLEDVAEGICAKVHETVDGVGTVLNDTVFVLTDKTMHGTEETCTGIQSDFQPTAAVMQEGADAIGTAKKTEAKLVHVSTLAIEQIKDTCVQTNTEPKANIGLFILGADDWEAGKAYERFDLIRYQGAIAWVKQAHTSQETWLPFSVGTESLYGARPVPDEDGVYPYVYNMAVDLGMKVRHEGVVYECIQGTESLLYEPAQAPALFTVVG